MKKKVSILMLLFILIGCSDTGEDDSVGADWYNKSDNEFIINTAKELAELAMLVNKGTDFTGKTVKLGADIMLNDTANWQDWANNPPANEWTPIGASKVIIDGGIAIDGGNAFKGNFDGNGYVISGVYINSTGSCKGLFGSVSRSGTIEKIEVVASYINGYEAVGGLVGCNYGTVNNNYFIGAVNGINSVGGLVGFNYNYKSNSNETGANATINDSYSAGVVTGTKIVGGLVGYNGKNIINSYSNSAVTGKKEVGGLVGYSYDDNSDASNVSNNYSTGNVKGEEHVGGLIGYISVCNVSNSYSTGNVEGEEYVGGFTGIIYHSSSKINNNYSMGTVKGSSIVGGFVGFSEGTISNSYSIGKVIGDSVVGGFSGLTSPSNGDIKNSFYDIETSGQSNASGHKNSYYAYPLAQGKITTEMKQKATFENWDFNYIWDMSDAINNGYPYLIW